MSLSACHAAKHTRIRYQCRLRIQVSPGKSLNPDWQAVEVEPSAICCPGCRNRSLQLEERRLVLGADVEHLRGIRHARVGCNSSTHVSCLHSYVGGRGCSPAGIHISEECDA